MGIITNDKGQPSNNLEEVNFSPKQMELYQKRYDEEYDIPDPRYLKWKEIYYPGENCNEWEELEKSLAEEFSYIEPCSPIALLDNTCTVGRAIRRHYRNKQCSSKHA